MSSPWISSVSKFFLTVLVVFSVTLVRPAAILKAQDATEEEIKAFDAIAAEKDPAAKVAAATKYVKANPKTAVLPNISADVDKVLGDLAAQRKWTQVISLGEQFVNAAPSDAYAVQLMATAYQETNNTKEFAPFAEKVFANKPSGPLAIAIAQAYKSSGNDAKFVQWGEKSLTYDANNLDIAMGLMAAYGRAANGPAASKYAKLVLKELPSAKKPEKIEDAAWTKQVNSAYASAYLVVGNVAYENKDFPTAISNLESATKYDKRNERAYYALGMSYWQTGKTNPAMMNFAKAYVLKGSTSVSAKSYLDRLYRASNRNVLTGEERIIQMAEQSLK